MLDDNKNERNHSIETIKPEEDKDNGKEITLIDEICFSWGFSYKREMVSIIGKDLSKLGYTVIINHWADRLKIGTYKIYIELEGKQVLLFSGNELDRTDKVIVSKHSNHVKPDLIERILNYVK